MTDMISRISSAHPPAASLTTLLDEVELAINKAKEDIREAMDCIDAASFALLDAQRSEWMGHARKRAAKAMFSCEAAIDNLRLVRE